MIRWVEIPSPVEVLSLKYREEVNKIQPIKIFWFLLPTSLIIHKYYIFVIWKKERVSPCQHVLYCTLLEIINNTGWGRGGKLFVKSECLRTIVNLHQLYYIIAVGFYNFPTENNIIVYTRFWRCETIVRPGTKKNIQTSTQKMPHICYIQQQYSH